MLVSLPPNLDLSRFANNLKTTTSRLIRKEFAAEVSGVYYRKPVLWSRSYCIVRCRRRRAGRDQAIHRTAGSPGVKRASRWRLSPPAKQPLWLEH